MTREKARQTAPKEIGAQPYMWAKYANGMHYVWITKRGCLRMRFVEKAGTVDVKFTQANTRMLREYLNEELKN